MTWSCDQCLITTNPLTSIKCLSCEALRPGLSDEEVARIEEDKQRDLEATANKFRSGATGTGFGSAEGPSNAPAFSFGFSASQPEASDGASFSFGFSAPVSPTPAPFIPSHPTSPSPFGFAPVTPGNTSAPKKNCEAPEMGRLPVGGVYVHGSGECDQLGLGEGVLERKKPTLLKSLDVNARSVASGSLHSAALTAEGAVYTWGCNDDGALGRTGTENLPEKVVLEGEAQIAAMSLGDCHSTFTDSEGSLWLCGTFKDSAGHLGFPSGNGLVVLKQSKPEKLIKKGVVSVASGSNHVAVLVRTKSSRPTTPKGGSGVSLFTFGNDEFGQLGLGERGSLEGLDEVVALTLKHSRRSKRKMQEKLSPRLVAWNERRYGRIAKVCCSGNCTFVITEDREVYGCGLNNFSQLGIGRPGANGVHGLVWDFLHISSLSGKNVVDIRGGSFHTVALTESGDVYGWGRGDYCGLGLTAGDVAFPRRVDVSNVKAIAAGGSHVICCDDSGAVWTWGFGETNQLGNNPRVLPTADAPSKAQDESMDEQTPYCVQSKQLADKFVFSVAAGAQHSVELAWTGEYADRKKRSRSEDEDLEEKRVRR